MLDNPTRCVILPYGTGIYRTYLLYSYAYGTLMGYLNVSAYRSLESGAIISLSFFMEALINCQDQEVPMMESALIFLTSLITLRTNLGLSEQVSFRHFLTEIVKAKFYHLEKFPMQKRQLCAS